ncbi:MAG: hypothetical protein ACOYNH_12070 [Bacteroidia bacterium]
MYIPVVSDAKFKQNFDSSSYSPQIAIKVASLVNFSFLDNSSNWCDLNHLSRKGAILFTNELIQKGIVKLPKKE